MNSSRLIVCFDGTWNTPDQAGEPTNVVKILRAIACESGGKRQVVFYDKGVGTGGVLDRLAGGASGKGLTQNMIDGYRFLANNYTKNDEIYIFGFSRGAYTARALAGLINFLGLFSPLHLGSDLAKGIDLYRKRGSSQMTADQSLAELLQNVERASPVPIDLLGVWDTVGSLGIPGDLFRRLLAKKYYFHDVQLGPTVQVALHALAIDEKRAQFPPTLWVRNRGEDAPSQQVVEQAWFPGVHSNVGGSYRDSGLSDVALDWMIRRVKEFTSLRFNEEYIAAHINPRPIDGRGIESRSKLYLGSKGFPYQRLLMQLTPNGEGLGHWFRDHFKKFDRRSIVPEGSVPIGERIHISALQRWNELVCHDCKAQQGTCKETPYRPSNLKAAIIRGLNGGDIPVCDVDGKLLVDSEVSWPGRNGMG